MFACLVFATSHCLQPFLGFRGVSGPSPGGRPLGRMAPVLVPEVLSVKKLRPPLSKEWASLFLYMKGMKGVCMRDFLLYMSMCVVVIGHE